MRSACYYAIPGRLVDRSFQRPVDDRNSFQRDSFAQGCGIFANKLPVVRQGIHAGGSRNEDGNSIVNKGPQRQFWRAVWRERIFILVCDVVEITQLLPTSLPVPALVWDRDK